MNSSNFSISFRPHCGAIHPSSQYRRDQIRTISQLYNANRFCLRVRAPSVPEIRQVKNKTHSSKHAHNAPSAPRAYAQGASHYLRAHATIHGPNRYNSIRHYEGRARDWFPRPYPHYTYVRARTPAHYSQTWPLPRMASDQKDNANATEIEVELCGEVGRDNESAHGSTPNPQKKKIGRPLSFLGGGADLGALACESLETAVDGGHRALRTARLCFGGEHTSA